MLQKLLKNYEIDLQEGVEAQAEQALASKSTVQQNEGAIMSIEVFAIFFTFQIPTLRTRLKFKGGGNVVFLG